MQDFDPSKNLMTRRDFLKFAGGATLSLFSLNPLLKMSSLAVPVPNQTPRMVVIFLRGAVDGLNIVVPSAENYYYELRPTIAIPEPGQAGGALALDNHFALHPALNALMPYWQQKKLAFVHACGSPNPTRSHFEAQDYMELGTPGSPLAHNGWMNRLLHVLPPPHTATQALNFGPTIPRILEGPETVANIASGQAASKPTLLDRPRIDAAFSQLYGGNDELSRTFQAGKQARQEIASDLQQEMQMANNGAPLPNNFVGTATQLASLLRRDERIKLAFVGLGGWDTHVNQGAAKGQLASRLTPLGNGLAALMNGLGTTLHNTTIVVMSEFGRTVKENGNQGTDHGHGNVMWIMGGSVHGGKVYGAWPGLDESARYEGRDLAVTTDFRDVLSSVLKNQYKLNTSQLEQIFPGFNPSTSKTLSGLF